MAVGLLPINPASAADVGAADVEDICPAPGQTDAFTDDTDNTFEDRINCAAAYDLVTGFPDGTFRPADFITRAQAATLLVNYVEVSDCDVPLETDADDDFTDVAGNVHEDNIEKAADNGIVVGYSDDTFRPDQLISRAQFATMAVQATELALGEVLTGDDDGDFDDIAGNVHESNIEKAFDNGMLVGTSPGMFSPDDNVTRGQATSIVIGAAGQILFPADEFCPAGGPTGGPNPTFTGAPELVSVSQSATEGDVVTFTFDETIPGQALRFFGDAPGRTYQDFRLYAPDGTVSFPREASISGSTVLARFASAAVVDAASRAGVAYDAVEDAQGIGNVEGDFPLQPASIPATPFEAYSPQLIEVENFRLAGTIIDNTQQVLVDFVFDDDSLFADGDLGTGFFLVGTNGALYEGLVVDSVSADGTRVTVEFADDLTDVPVSQLRRGFVEYPDDEADFGFIILSEDYANTGGQTVDPDLTNAEIVDASPVAERVVRYEFDEAVSDTGLSPADFILFDADGFTITADEVARSAAEDDQATVVLATFDTTGFVPVGAYLETSAVIATDNTASSNFGGNQPDERTLTLPATPDDTTFPAGVTALPDLLSVSRSQNTVTGNYTVAFTFDGDVCAVAGDVAFDLYDELGTQFRVDDVAAGQPGVTCYFTGPVATRTWTVAFSVDQGLSPDQFDNEQIAAAVTGAVEDEDNIDLELTPSVTESQQPITLIVPAVTGPGTILDVDDEGLT